MKNVGENIKKCLQKSQEALHQFQRRKDAFLINREQILTDIEQARIIWIKTLEQLPGQEFNNINKKINGEQAKRLRKSIRTSNHNRINPLIINHHEQ
jgi:hypothetical protein